MPYRKNIRLIYWWRADRGAGNHPWSSNTRPYTSSRLPLSRSACFQSRDSCLENTSWLTDYLPKEVEREVLIKKTGVNGGQADGILDTVEELRGNADLPVEISTRTTLMIGEMVAAGASLRQAVSVSLQTDKDILESILISLHMEKGYIEKGRHELTLFTKDVVFDRN